MPEPQPRPLGVYRPPTAPNGADVALRLALTVFMLAFGFSALRTTVARLEGEIAREHRGALARQGWIV